MTEITARREKRKRPRGYYSWRPQKKTVALLEQVDDVLAEYAEHLPLTVRQIFYRLVGSYDYEKTEKAYDRLAEALVLARRARLVDFEDIRDDGVVVYSPAWYPDQQAFWNDTAIRVKSYRRDRQAGQPGRLELWCEAAGMAPQLARVANDYSVPVYSSGGFSSLSAVRTIVDRAANRAKPTVLLHVGDFDPSGEAIFNSIAEDAAAFLTEDRYLASQQIVAVRVALTAAQVSDYGLPTSPAKASDSRSAAWRGGTCQLEALAPDQLAKIVRHAIEERIDNERFLREVRAEDADRIELWRGLPEGSGT